MFRKFFEACTITLGLYLCLQFSNFVEPFSNVVWFKSSRFENLPLFNFQETVPYQKVSPWKADHQLNPKVNHY